MKFLLTILGFCGFSWMQSIKFNKVRNGLIEGISSLNSKAFHIFIVLSYNIKANNLNITAPGNSPNTDGIHISQTDIVSITNSIIGTGDDCVSIGHGSTNITVANITCGPGHGIRYRYYICRSAFVYLKTVKRVFGL